MQQSRLASCPVKPGSPGWPGELGWESIYEYMLHDQGTAICWQQHCRYKPAPPPPPPSPNTHWGRISKDCGWGPRLVQQTFAWRQGKGMSNLPVKDPAKIGPSFLSRWVVNPLWLWGMFLLFQVCFSGHLNLAMNGAARNSGYRPT